VIDGSLVPESVFVVDGGDLTLDGVEVTGGTGTYTEVSDIFLPFAAKAGGAINALTGDGGTVTVSNCEFRGNSAAAGGAIAARTLVVTDSTFTANTADPPEPAAGGAVWIGPGGLLTVERTVFEGNTADFGGALVAYSPTTLLEVEGMDNVAHMNGGFGQIQSASLGPPVVPNTLDVIAGQFHDNTAVGSGGVLALLSSSGSADEATTFDSNLSINNAGAVLIDAFASTVTWDGGVFTNNFADDDGGAIHLEPWDGAIVVSGVQVVGNTATEEGGGISAYTMEGDMYAVRPGRFVISDSFVMENETLSSDGGGIYVEGHFFSDADAGPLGTVERVQFLGNLAEGNGGGLDLAWYTHVEVVDCVFEDNAANGQMGGGGISVAMSIVDVTSTGFIANQPNDVLAQTYFEGEVVFTPSASDDSFTCDSANGEPYCL
jgi:predicted outer membrane repeat protein